MYDIFMQGGVTQFDSFQAGKITEPIWQQWYRQHRKADLIVIKLAQLNRKYWQPTLAQMQGFQRMIKRKLGTQSLYRASQ